MHPTQLMTSFTLVMVSIAVALPAIGDTFRRNGTGRIVGGSHAAKGQFPWQAEISHDNKLNGGVLVGTQWVLTSAFVFYAELGTFTIYLGTNVLHSSDMVQIDATSSISHPQFNYDTMENALALMKLSKPVPESSSIRPIVLSTAALSDGATITVSGFGAQGDGSSYNADLMFLQLSILSNADCSRIFSNIRENIFCGVGIGVQGICNGDIGIPAVNSNNQLVGVGLFLSGSGCEAGRPSGFTRIAPYVSWINSVTG